LKNSRLARTVSALVLALIASGLANAQAQEVDSNRIGIVTPSVFLQEIGGIYSGEVTFTISGPAAMALEVELLDAWSDDQGGRILLPAGTTPLSGNNRLMIGEHQDFYEPNNVPQRITIPVSIESELISSRPLLSAVRLVMRSKSVAEQDKPLGVVAAAASFVYASKTTLDTKVFAADYSVEKLAVAPISQKSSNDSLQHQFFIERGPAKVIFEAQNSGNLFTTISNTVTLNKLNLWPDSRAPATPLLSTDFAETLMLPLELRKESLSLVDVLAGSHREVDLLSDWGLYEVSVISTSLSGSMKEIVSVRTTHFLVFPIRMLFTITIGLLIIFLLLAIRRPSRTRLSKKPEKPPENHNSENRFPDYYRPGYRPKNTNHFSNDSRDGS
jgi:hypothetical protein